MNDRACAILAALTRAGIEKPEDVRYTLFAFRDVPFSFPNGETWQVGKVAEFEAEIVPRMTSAYIKPHWERVTKYTLKSSAGRRTVYNTATRPGKVAREVLKLYQDEFDKELILDGAIFPLRTPMLDALERYIRQ